MPITTLILWHEQMKSWIVAYGIDGLVDGSLTRPSHFLDSSNSTPNPDFLSWNRLNSMLEGWIFNMVTSEISIHVSNKDITYEQWLSLEIVFCPQCLCKDNLLISDYLANAKSVAHHLVAIGASISYHDMILYLMARLGPNYFSIC